VNEEASNMEINCVDTSARLLDLLDGSLDDIEKTLIEEHLAGCQRCRKKLDQMSGAHQFLQTELPQVTDSISAPEFLGLRIKHMLSHGNDRWQQGHRTRKVWATAAAVAILVTAALAYNLIYNTQDKPDTPPAKSTPTVAANKPEPRIIVIINPNLLKQIQRRDTMPAGLGEKAPSDDDYLPGGRLRRIRPAPQVQSPVLMVKPVQFNRDM